MAKKAKLSTLEKNAWKACSKYIRTRDCLLTTKTPDAGRCFTCGCFKDIRELDAGHFVKSTHKAVKFDERNIKAQCQKCNRFEGGREADFTLKLIDEIGREGVDELISMRHVPKLRNRDDFLDIKKDFEDKLKALIVS